MFLFLLRVSEATGLKRKHIQFQTRANRKTVRIYLERTKTGQRGKQPQWVELPTIGLPIDPYTLCKNLCDNKAPEDLIFSFKNKPLSTSEINKYLKFVMPKYVAFTKNSQDPVRLEPYKKWTSHMWRASGIGALFASDIHIQLIAEHSRHASNTICAYIRKNRGANLVKLGRLWERHFHKQLNHPSLNSISPALENSHLPSAQLHQNLGINFH